MPAPLARLVLLCALCLGAIGPMAQAQTYPDRPVRAVIPFPPGGGADVLARIVFERAAKSLGQPFVIENIGGAGGNLGTNTVARAEPDGYRVVLSAVGPLSVNKTLTKNLPYDPEKDFEPIALMASMPNIVVVGNQVPVASLKELIDYIKARPGQVNYASIGNGSSQHLAGVLFEQLTGTRMTHLPYRAAGQMASDLVAGVVPLSFILIPNVLGQLQANSIKALAVSAKQRVASQPTVPTTVEAGLPGFISAAWFAMLGPKGTPRPIVDKLNAVIVEAIKDPAVNKRLVEAGIDPLTSTPEELRAHISAEVARWREVVTKANLSVE